MGESLKVKDLELAKEIAAEAAGYLMTDGWCQNAYDQPGKIGPYDQHCAVGAIREAAGVRFGDRDDLTNEALDRAFRVSDAMDHVLYTMGKSDERWGALIRWNDKRGRKVEQVVGFFQDFAEGRFDNYFNTEENNNG